MAYSFQKGFLVVVKLICWRRGQRGYWCSCELFKRIGLLLFSLPCRWRRWWWARGKMLHMTMVVCCRHVAQMNLWTAASASRLQEKSFKVVGQTIIPRTCTARLVGLFWLGLWVWRDEHQDCGILRYDAAELGMTMRAHYPFIGLLARVDPCSTQAP